jgi:hypothetical protein
MAPSAGGGHRAGELKNSCAAVILAAAVAGNDCQGGATGSPSRFEATTPGR